MPNPPESDAAKPLAEQLDALFAPWNRTDAPGLTVGVVLDGACVYRRGFGMASLETFVANSPRTRIRIGSASKHFACVLALLLAEEGKLDLEAPIRAYLPELTGPSGEPTLRQLMRHRGGTRCSLDVGFIARGAATPPLGQALQDMVRQTGRNFAPGEAMLYNNGGYHLLSIAIERVGGAPFEAQLKARLFDPLGMADTASIPTDHVIAPGAATLHVPSPDGGWRRGLFPSEEVRGEGAIVSTVDDMLTWMAHLRRQDRFGRPESWAQMFEPPPGADLSVGQYGLGLRISRHRGQRTIAHAGGVIGGLTQMLLLPDMGLEVIILANGAPGADPVKLALHVADIVLGDRLDQPRADVPAADHAAHLGEWWSEESGLIYALVDDEGSLRVNICKSPYAIPIVRSATRGLVSPSESVGELTYDLSAEDEIVIGFAGRTARYRRVTEADPAPFSAAARGRYRSHDAGATAEVFDGEGGLRLRLSDPFGRIEVRLTPIGTRTAAITPGSPLDPLCGVFNLTADGGFRIDTMRTRDLAFQRAVD